MSNKYTLILTNWITYVLPQPYPVNNPSYVSGLPEWSTEGLCGNFNDYPSGTYIYRPTQPLDAEEWLYFDSNDANYTCV